MNEDTKTNVESVPETQDQTKNEELNADQLDEVAGGGFHGSSGKNPGPF